MEVTEESWPSWTAKSYAIELVIDGNQITKILSNIAIQLDTLRKRKYESHESRTKEGKLFDDVFTDLWAKLALLEEALKKGVGGNDDRVPGLEMRVKTIERRLDSIEGLVNDKSEYTMLESKLMSRLEAMEKKFNDMFANQKKGLDEEELVGRIVKLETEMGTVNTTMPIIEGNVSTLTTDMFDAKNAIEVIMKKLKEVSNLVGIHDIKIGEMEGLIEGLHSGSERLKEIVEHLPEELMRKVMVQMDLMDEKKADRVDLMKKADLVDMMKKADAADMDKLGELVTELSMRLNAVKTHTDERFGEFQRMYDKKLEALLQWILKQLKKLANKEAVSGTDIGKVRCLVCDTPVKQALEQDVVFSGHNPITMSLKKLHAHVRPVPFENDADPRKDTRYQTQPQAWARLPTKDQDRSASPLHDAQRGPGRGRSPPRDRHSHSPPQERHTYDTSISSSLPQLRGPQGPIVLPTAFSSGGATVFLQQQPEGEVKMSAFKEMELRYAGPGHGGHNKSASSASGGGETNSRPRSAPMNGRMTGKANNA